MRIRKSVKFRFIAILTLVLMLAQILTLSAFAESTPEAGIWSSPAESQMTLTGTPLTTESGYGLGYIAPPVNLSSSQPVSRAYQGILLPDSYDLRDYNRVTPVQNQSIGGNCWAFAACGSAESSYVTTSGVSYTQNYFS